MDMEQQEKVMHFSAVTGANPSTARTALSSANWNLEQAVALYLAASEGDEQHEEDDDDDVSAPPPQTSQPTGQGPSQPPRAPATGQSRNARRGNQQPRTMTLKDLQGGEDDEEDDDDDRKRDLFAGGEKSGLAVQDPSQGGGPMDHFRNIMNQARQNRDRPSGPDSDGDEGEATPSRPNHFSGRAQTLGGDDAPSRVIDDPRSRFPQRQSLPRVTRTLHLWSDGVSIDEGPLFRFDDPANQEMMAQINQGQAPLSLLDVQPGQEVDLNLIPHKDEKFVPPKPAFKPFSGQGQRLGSPTPGPAPSTTSTTTAPSAQPAVSTQQPAQPQIDEATPSLQLQIRLGDGTALRSRFNTTHTIGDVYAFVDRASPASTQRAYALMTTFPAKELDDRSKVLGEMSEYKRGGVIVQKWK